MPMSSPPPGFGLQWRRFGARYTRAGLRVLHIAEADTPAFAAAYRVARDGLRAVGYGYGTEGRDGGVLLPAFWLNREGEEAVARAAVADAEEAVRAEEARVAAEREADWALHGGWRTERLENLRRVLHERAWALGAAHAEAVELASLERPDGWQAERAGLLAYQADESVRRAEERLAAPVHEDELRLMESLERRAAVHEACRILSGLDADRARLRNGIGWSQRTSWTGHLLFGRAELTRLEAAHAWRLVRVHRSQLPRELRVSIFGAES